MLLTIDAEHRGPKVSELRQTERNSFDKVDPPHITERQ
jgi:hypothetical protein